jgi:hypothetical protein
MTRRASAHSCLWAGIVMSFANVSRAGVWETDPVLGLAAEFSSNPALLNISHTAETHGAVLIDAPTTYRANSESFTVQPSFRISDSSGYSSLASDYAHLTMIGQLDGELSTLIGTAQTARDSSLYYDYALNGSTGVRRDTTLADVAWSRALAERLSLNLEVNSSKVAYEQPSSSTNLTNVVDLTNYRYTSGNPTLSWKTSERTTLTIQGSAGLYESSDGATKSVNSTLGFGVKRQLTELWSLTANGGISRETNTIKVSEGGFSLGTFHATDNGTVFSAQIVRQGQLLSLSATASRSLVPTGFSFLAVQESYQLGFEYPLSARWTLDGHVRRLKSSDPQAFGPTVEEDYTDAGLSAAWLFTEKWTVTLRASRITAKSPSQESGVNASGVALQLSRRFDSLKWQ